MEEQKNNIRVILSDKAEKVLEDILRGFNLEEKNVLIDRLVKDYARETLSEKDFIAGLQKEINISPEISEKLAKEIITKLVPMLEKFPEEKFNDPNFREEISRKIFDEGKPTVVKPLENIKSDNIVTDKAPDKMPEKIPSKVSRGKSRLPQKPPATIGKKPLPKTSVLQAKPRTGPDNYREPIE
jgi:hypothetical protein